MYDRIARTGPLRLATIAPAPLVNVCSLRPHSPSRSWFLCRSRTSTPLAPGAVMRSASSIQRSVKRWA
jgi:hypothetical protein